MAIFRLGYSCVVMICIVLLVALLYPLRNMAIEEPAFVVEKKYDSFEVRKYAAVLVAQTENNAPFEDAGNQAFRILADYIFGNNVAKSKIAMTAPVTQQSEKIAMTAPVNVSRSGAGYVVQFTMPAIYTRETLPKPIDTRVQIAEIPARSVAVFSYSGSWSEERYQKKLAEFREQLAKENIKTLGEAVFARYNSPFQLWFLRRNEIWLELAQ